MKQFIVNKLEGGYVVQTVVDGQQIGQKIKTTLVQVDNDLWNFFDDGIQVAVAKQPNVAWEGNQIGLVGGANVAQDQEQKNPF